MAKGKKAVLVITDPGMPPTVFVVPDEALVEDDIKRLNRLLEYVGSYDFDAEEFQECANLREVHNHLIKQLGLEDDEEAPEFDWYPDQKLAVTRAEVQKRELEAPVTGRTSYGTTSGRLSSKGDHLANLPKPGPSLRQKAKIADFGSPSPTGRFPSEPELQHINPLLKTNPRENMSLDFDYAELERRLSAVIGKPIMQVYDEFIYEVEENDLLAARAVVENIFNMFRQTIPLAEIGPWTLYDRGLSRWSSEGSNLQELPKKLKTPNGKEIDRTWDPCCEGCLGWLHMNSPYEIEQCDECRRFELTPDGHEAARKAHKEECGCGWPEFDIQDAAMAWVGDLSIYERTLTHEDISEINSLMDERGVKFMDNITPAIYACSRLLEKTKDESRNRVTLSGLMKLLKDTQEKINDETLKLKDFGSPPGAEEESD